MEGKCENCRFWRAGGIPVNRTGAFDLHLIYGECRRFPQYVQRRPRETCGEYQTSPEEAATGAAA
jgi:hypothetical protein